MLITIKYYRIYTLTGWTREMAFVIPKKRLGRQHLKFDPERCPWKQKKKRFMRKSGFN